MNSSLSSLLHLQGLPPLPRSLSGYGNSSSSSSYNPHPQQHQPLPLHQSYGHGHGSPQNFSSSSGIHSQPPHFLMKGPGGIGSHGHRPSPVPPPRPHSRRSSSSGSSFRASPDHVSNNRGIVGATEPIRSSPRSLSSSPHSPHIDSGFGRSSADSFSERAFVRVIKSPHGGTANKLDAQLSQLRRDMQHLRQQDMSLLGHLLQINQGIQDLKSVLVPPPQPAPSIPMFHSTPLGYSPNSIYGNPPPPRHARKLHHPSPVSRGAKLFARRSSTDKMLAEKELGLGALGAVGGLREKDEDSDSLSSLEFGDV